MGSSLTRVLLGLLVLLLLVLVLVLVLEAQGRFLAVAFQPLGGQVDGWRGGAPLTWYPEQTA